MTHMQQAEIDCHMLSFWLMSSLSCQCTQAAYDVQVHKLPQAQGLVNVASLR